MNGNGNVVVGLMLVVVLVLVLVAGCMVVIPQYNVWQKGLKGKAELAEAEFGRQSLVMKARADKEAAALLAEAEVLRADGASKSAKIIGEGLEANPHYLQYLAIQAQMQMANSPNHTTVYIPSGVNGIPIVKMVP
jgi:regulator of protease activity HflC (stomatin/prohibitin superfamily)